MDNTIHWINHYPADGVVCFENTIYPVDSVIQPSNNLSSYGMLRYFFALVD